MKLRLVTLTAAALAASIVSATPAVADPGVSTPPPVGYHATVDNASLLTTLDNGVFVLADDQSSVEVHNTAGGVVDTLPLAARVDGQGVPIGSEISDDGHSLRLTPNLTHLDRSALTPVASPLENQLAMNDLINAVSIGTSLGSLVGTAIGAVLGVGVGFVLAGAACAVLSVGCVVTVLPIMALVAGVGGVAGLVLGGGPTAAVGVFDYVTTLNAEPGTSKYAADLQGRPRVPAQPAAVN